MSRWGFHDCLMSGCSCGVRSGEWVCKQVRYWRVSMSMTGSGFDAADESCAVGMVPTKATNRTGVPLQTAAINPPRLQTHQPYRSISVTDLTACQENPLSLLDSPCECGLFHTVTCGYASSSHIIFFSFAAQSRYCPACARQCTSRAAILWRGVCAASGACARSGRASHERQL